MRDGFTTLIEELRSTPEIAVLGAELGPAASEAELARLATWFGGTIPPDVQAFYSQVGSVQIRWVETANPAYPACNRGVVRWEHALMDPVDEEGLLFLPPVDVVLERSWEQDLSDLWIWISGRAHEGTKVEAGAIDSALRIFDFSSYQRWPGFFRASGLVGVGTEMGWQGARIPFHAHLDGALSKMRRRVEAARCKETEY